MRTGYRRFLIGVMRTGILLTVAGILLFLYKIPWEWMQEGAVLLIYGDKEKTEKNTVIYRSVTEHIPLYTYAGCGQIALLSLQSRLSEEEILLLEARDEGSEVSERSEEILTEEKERELFNEKLMAENAAVRETQKEEGADAEEATSAGVSAVQEISMDKYHDFDLLLQDFYVVDRSTYITAEELNIDKLLNYDLRLNAIKSGEPAEGPQVLIYHTHSQEAYADSVPGDKSMTVVGAGEKLAQLLENYGIGVLHHTGEYDVESRDYAYANVEPVLKQILEENPSIEVVIDLHRDGVADDTHLVTEIDGKPTAQFMFFNGLSRLKSAGEIEYLKNENRMGNLAFSFQLQKKCMEYYPGIARSIYLKGYRYNMQYLDKSLLVELGAQTNTVEEIENALGPLAHVISMVLKGE